MNIPFKRGNILLPKNTDMTKWSVVACDQYTSEPEYWNDVEKIVGDAPSTLKLTLPEIYLEDENVSERIAKKYDVNNKEVLLFAMGDGNHSLSTAKACYEKLKETMSEEEYINNPARYALVELVNLHSPALEFEAINRVIFNTKPEKLLNSLKEYYQINKDGNGQKIEVITNDVDEKWYIENPKSNIASGSIQIFLD